MQGVKSTGHGDVALTVSFGSGNGTGSVSHNAGSNANQQEV